MFAVSDDVANVGLGDIGQMRYAPAPLTTMQRFSLQIGELAVSSLVRKI